jgi:hypothetical protein
MNKAELLADLGSKVIKIIGQVGMGRTTNGGDKEYEINCLTNPQDKVCEERIIPIRVLNEGTPEESAYYVTELPVNREAIIKQKLLELQAQGEVTGNDLTHLGIKFADLNLNGQRILVTVLNEETIIIKGA